MAASKGTAPVPGSSHSSPAPIGITVKTTVERGDSYSGAELCDLGITVLEVILGKAAQERIKAQGVANKPVKAGFEYLLARLRFFYSRRGAGFEEEGTYSVSEGQFITASNDGMKEYEPPPVLKQPEPGLIDLPLHPGETREGWIVLQVPEKDKQPLLVFKRQHVEAIYGLRGYVWFQLH
jgi:hypothetical protein